jgi:hypothetical protein
VTKADENIRFFSWPEGWKSGWKSFQDHKKEGQIYRLTLCFYLAGSMGLEPTASGVTGRRYNQLNYDPETQFIALLLKPDAAAKRCSLGDAHDFSIFMVGGTGLEPVTSTV